MKINEIRRLHWHWDNRLHSTLSTKFPSKELYTNSNFTFLSPTNLTSIFPCSLNTTSLLEQACTAWYSMRKSIFKITSNSSSSNNHHVYFQLDILNPYLAITTYELYHKHLTWEVLINIPLSKDSIL